MSDFKQNKHYKLHKITNIFYLIIVIPFLIIGIISALSMYSTKAAGGLPNMLGYYAIEMQNNTWYWDASVNPAHPNNAQMTALYGKYKKGNVILFKAVNINDLKEGDRVIYYNNPSDSEINGSYPEWQPLNATYSNSQNEVATVAMAELAGKKATITDENGKQYTCFSYYKSYVKLGETTTEELLISDNIIGVEIQNNDFLKGIILFVSSFNGFLTLVVAPMICLVILKIISFACYRKYLSATDFNQQTPAFATGPNVSYAKVVQGARQTNTTAPQRPGIPTPPPLRQNPQNKTQQAGSGHMQSPQPRMQQPISQTPLKTQQPQHKTPTTIQPQKTNLAQPRPNNTANFNPQSARAARKQQQQENQKIVSTRLANKNKK